MQYNTNYKYNVSIKMYKIHYIYIVVDFKSTLFYILCPLNITALFILLYYDYDLHENYIPLSIKIFPKNQKTHENL